MNRYYDNSSGKWVELDVFNPPKLDRGKDYYVDVFRIIESEGTLTGYTFYMSELVPKSLPVADRNTILLVVSDERYRYASYFADIACILRTYGSFPQFREGLPFRRVTALSLLQFLYKSTSVIINLLKCTIQTRNVSYFRVMRRTMHVPLSCFFRFQPFYHPIADRSITYSFLGSVDYDSRRKNFLHILLTPPKLASRSEMLHSMELFQARSGVEFKLHKTGDFEESIKNQSRYVEALENSKISLCPRGSNYETYRFFESMKAGCVVICEHLPEAWFYSDHPAIKISNWALLPRLLEKLISEPETLQHLSSAAAKYWETELSETAVAGRITDFVKRTKFADANLP